MISSFLSFSLQKIAERAFDGLNNLQRLNLENNNLKLLERGLFTGVPALIYLNLMKNSLETITYNNMLPLMDNLVNNTNSILDITGAFYKWQFIKCHAVMCIYDFLPHPLTFPSPFKFCLFFSWLTYCRNNRSERLLKILLLIFILFYTA
jgi:hypothetical protein